MNRKIFSVFFLWRELKLRLCLNLTLILAFSLTFNLSATVFEQDET